jgi:hypothetical protein
LEQKLPGVLNSIHRLIPSKKFIRLPFTPLSITPSVLQLFYEWVRCVVLFLEIPTSNPSLGNISCAYGLSNEIMDPQIISASNQMQQAEKYYKEYDKLGSKLIQFAEII